MIGYELQFINAEHDENHVIDSEGPFFEITKQAVINILKETKAFFDGYKQHGQILICENEYLGNEVDGYDFNAPLSSVRCFNQQDVFTFFNNGDL